MLSPEKTLQLQLEVSDTLTRHTTRDGIGLALAGVLNKVAPFDFFLHSIWISGATTSYRISSAKMPNGEFEVIDDVLLEKIRREKFDEFVRAGLFLSDPKNSGVYQGEDFKKLADSYQTFGLAYYHHQVRSMVVLFMAHENGFNHSMVLSNRSENAFTQNFFLTLKTLLPQVKMAFDNLFKYEELRKEEENKRTQLELNNVLLGHTNIEDFGIALAQTINKRVPCERFIIRTWTGPVQLGYRMPLVRQEDGTFKRFSEMPMLKQTTHNPQHMLEATNFLIENPGIHQGEAHKRLQERYPMIAMAARQFGIHSTMILTFKMDETVCLITLANNAEESFHESQYQLMQMLLPQIILAFDNLMKYERLRDEEKKKKIQLELNNELLGHTNRDEFGIALAKIINKIVPSERILLRLWTGSLNLGYRLPLSRNEDGSYSRFQEFAILEQIEKNPGMLISGANFMANLPGIYQGEVFKDLCTQHEIFDISAKQFKIQSIMVLSFKTKDHSCLIILGNDTAQSFHEEQYKLLNVLLPQVILSFDNLFKYEKLKQEEEERKVQVGILTAFNATGRELDEMALDAIAQVNNFISFDYWINIATVPRGKDMDFRLAYKIDRKMLPTFGPELFTKLGLEPMKAEEFSQAYKFLYEGPRLYVGEHFDTLRLTIPFFEAFHKNYKLNSVIIFPVTTQGQMRTLIMMGSKREYAFTEDDLNAMKRILPYIGMAAQQYYQMFHIQSLKKQLEMEKEYLVEEIKLSYNFDEIVGSSSVMSDIFKQIAQVSPMDSTVLVLGETGTGKELIARAIHNQSPRKDKVLVKINCASLPAQLIESELFGHEKGSFTGALEKRIGKFELANGGSIFLDEIGELPLELQAKLLRVLQEREIERIGGKTTIPLDVRIIAATNRDLETEVAEGRFRSDLFYRLSVFPISIPPLRHRKEDIPLLINHFLQRFSKKFKRQLKPLSESVLRELVEYEWPGNIRELENVIEQGVIVGDVSSVRLRKASPKRNEPARQKETDKQYESHEEAEIIQVLKLTKGKISGPEGAAAILNMRASKIEEAERKWILSALKIAAGRVRGENGAAEMIGVKPTTLEARMKKLHITKAEIFG